MANKLMVNSLAFAIAALSASAYAADQKFTIDWAQDLYNGAWNIGAKLPDANAAVSFSMLGNASGALPESGTGAYTYKRPTISMVKNGFFEPTKNNTRLIKRTDDSEQVGGESGFLYFDELDFREQDGPVNFGTHYIGADINFRTPVKDLTFSVLDIDMQHRFGVEQEKWSDLARVQSTDFVQIAYKEHAADQEFKILNSAHVDIVASNCLAYSENFAGVKGVHVFHPAVQENGDSALWSGDTSKKYEACDAKESWLTPGHDMDIGQTKLDTQKGNIKVHFGDLAVAEVQIRLLPKGKNGEVYPSSIGVSDLTFTSADTDGDGIADVADDKNRVNVEVVGLDSNQKVNLSLNGGAATRFGNGVSSFGQQVAFGDKFSVTAASPEGLECKVTNGEGASLQGENIFAVVSCSKGEDTAAPTIQNVVFEGLEAGKAIREPVTVAVTFDKNTHVDLDKISAYRATLSNLKNNGTKKVSFTLTPNANQQSSERPLNFTIGAIRGQENGVILTTQTYDGTYSIDTLKPKATFTANSDVLKKDEKATLTLHFNEKLAPLTQSNFEVSSGELKENTFTLNAKNELVLTFIRGSGTDPRVVVKNYSDEAGNIGDNVTWTVGDGNDSDEDELTNADEDRLGTNKNNKDSDGDGAGDKYEIADVKHPRDSDGDGKYDAVDDDDDNDGIVSSDENKGNNPTDDASKNNPDVDGDGILNSVDLDSDGDGIKDEDEKTDADNSGVIDAYEPKPGSNTRGGGDSDGDGISDKDECGNNGNPQRPCKDSDGDGIPDHMDTDSDDNGVDDKDEGDLDTDGDGIKDAADSDDDNDGKSDVEEGSRSTEKPDADNDGIIDSKDVDDSNKADMLDGSGDSDKDGLSDKDECKNGGDVNVRCVDSDGDHIPDYMDTDSDNDGEDDKDDSDPTNACLPNPNAEACTNGNNGNNANSAPSSSSVVQERDNGKLKVGVNGIGAFGLLHGLLAWGLVAVIRRRNVR